MLEVIPKVLHRHKFVQARGRVGAWDHAIIRSRAVPGGAKVKEEVEFRFLSGFLAPLMSALLDQQARASIRSELNNFNTFVEHEMGREQTSEAQDSRLASLVENHRTHPKNLDADGFPRTERAPSGTVLFRTTGTVWDKSFRLQTPDWRT